MKDYLTLRIMDKFKNLFIKFGIDYRVMRKIVELKIKMDSRKVPTILANDKVRNKEKNSFKLAMWVYFIFGICAAGVMFTPMSVLPKMSMVLGIVIFMIMTTLVADFSSVLLDGKDKNILIPKPIDTKTINVAKVIHILNYLVSLTIAIAGPSLIVGFVKYGIIFGVVFLIELILINITMILSTALLYFLLLYFFDGEKIKDIINYFQIFLSITIIIGYQLIGRIFEFVDINIKFDLKWWHGLVPSVLFSAPLSIIGDGDYQTYNLIFSVLVIIIPIVSFIIYIKVVVPYFEKNIQKLNDNSGISLKKMEKRFKKINKIAKIICKSGEEKAGYTFTRNMCSKERDFKLKLYPTLAMACVLPFICTLVFMDAQSLSEIRSQFFHERLYFTIYLAIASLATTIPMIMYSEKFKASWLFKVLPISHKENVLKGTFKGYVFHYSYPVYIFLCIIYLLMAGPNIILDLITTCFALNICLLISFRRIKEYPFSKESLVGNGEDLRELLVNALVTLVLGFGHYILVNVKNGNILVLVIMFIINIILWNIVFKKPKGKTVCRNIGERTI